MKHPVKDRILILLLALVAMFGTVAAVALAMGKVTLDPVIQLMARASFMGTKTKIILIVIAIVLALLALALIGMTMPAKKKRSSNFAIQQNENGMVRISLKALDTLVQKCLNSHAELKVVTSSLFSDEQSVRVDVHIALQSDISMPLAISALQKQIKKYLEACTGVVIKEVRVFVDSTLPANDETAKSPYAIPASLMGMEKESLPAAKEPEIAAEPEETPAAEIETVVETTEVTEAVKEEEAPVQVQAEEPAPVEEAPIFSDSTEE